MGAAQPGAGRQPGRADRHRLRGRGCWRRRGGRVQGAGPTEPVRRDTRTGPRPPAALAPTRDGVASDGQVGRSRASGRRARAPGPGGPGPGAADRNRRQRAALTQRRRPDPPPLDAPVPGTREAGPPPPSGLGRGGPDPARPRWPDTAPPAAALGAPPRPAAAVLPASSPGPGPGPRRRQPPGALAVPSPRSSAPSAGSGNADVGTRACPPGTGPPAAVTSPSASGRRPATPAVNRPTGPWLRSGCARSGAGSSSRAYGPDVGAARRWPSPSSCSPWPGFGRRSCCGRAHRPRLAGRRRDRRRTAWRPRQRRDRSPQRRAASPAPSGPAANIYRWLPFTQADLTEAAGWCGGSAPTTPRTPTPRARTATSAGCAAWSRRRWRPAWRGATPRRGGPGEDPAEADRHGQRCDHRVARVRRCRA